MFDVLDDGPVDGEPVVLLHGWPERATVWRHVAPILNAAGYRTLAMDRRGFAPGARPKRRRDYKLPILAADVAALIDEIGGSAHVVGHDWGAAVAWTVAGHYPDQVRTLTAVSVGHPAAFMKAMVKSDQLLKSYYMLAFNLPFLPELLVRRRADLVRPAAAQGRHDQGRRGPLPRGDRRRRRAARPRWAATARC